MMTRTWSYFALPGQSWFVTFGGCWAFLPWWLVDGEYGARTQREQITFDSTPTQGATPWPSSQTS